MQWHPDKHLDAASKVCNDHSNTLCRIDLQAAGRYAISACLLVVEDGSHHVNYGCADCMPQHSHKQRVFKHH